MIFLAWLLLHNATPTNGLRFDRGLADSPRCNRCSGGLEDGLHCFRDCPHSLEIWTRLGFIATDDFFHQHLLSWVEIHLRRPRGVLFLVVLWWCWRLRNEMVLGNVKWSIQDVLHRIDVTYRDVATCWGADDLDIVPVAKEVKWMPPQMGWIKLNTDGSCLGNPRKAGFGGLLRDDQGAWIHGFSAKIDIIDVLAAELHAMRFGLSLAWDLGHRNILCEIDSKEAVRLTTADAFPYFHIHGTVLADIRALLQRQWNVRVSHMFREGNFCANALAKRGATQMEEVTLWNSPPSDLHQLLLADCMGVVFNRV